MIAYFLKKNEIYINHYTFPVFICFIWIQLRWGKKGNFLKHLLIQYLVIESSEARLFTRQSFLRLFSDSSASKAALLPWLPMCFSRPSVNHTIVSSTVLVQDQEIAILLTRTWRILAWPGFGIGLPGNCFQTSVIWLVGQDSCVTLMHYSRPRHFPEMELFLRLLWVWSEVELSGWSLIMYMTPMKCCQTAHLCPS